MDIVEFRKNNAIKTLARECPESEGFSIDLPHPSMRDTRLIQYIDRDGIIHSAAYCTSE